MEDRPLIEARKITYQIGSQALLTDVSIRVAPGEVVAIIGPNGAGKSTLRKILTGDLEPASGVVLMSGRPLSEWTTLDRARVRAVLPQDSSLNFPFTVQEVVLMGRTPHVRGSETANDHRIAAEALAAVEADQLRERLYPTLSGGERQRVHLARMLAQVWEAAGSATRYLLLDEPTTSLDIAHQHSALRVVRRFSGEGVGVFVVLHDLNLAAQYADRIVMLKAGRVVAEGIPELILTVEIIQATFDLRVTVMWHPDADRPVVLAD
ncbi:MAG: heme ABC transporter ATP-binding protein [Pyrinomonadaceae bacterium]